MAPYPRLSSHFWELFPSIQRPNLVETLTNHSDNDLIQATLAGNPTAFEGLVRRYQDRLLVAMTAVCGAVTEAEDVVQETFLQAYCKLDGFRNESRFYTWLYRIAFNLSVNLRRKKRPLTGTGGGLDRPTASERSGPSPDFRLEQVDPTPGPEELLDRQEEAALLKQAIDRLPQEFRQVLVLRELEGFCYETISEVLGLPIGTVRSRLHRARQQLKDDLSEWL